VRISIYKDLTELSIRVANIIVNSGRKAIREKGEFSIALSGGETPKSIFKNFVSDSLKELIDWRKVAFFWIDERMVAPEDTQSNFGNARTIFLNEITGGKIFRIKGESRSAEQAASEYRQLLQNVFKTEKGEIPIIDFILLGVGTDGHVASLFSDTDSHMSERDTLVIPTYNSELKQHRVSMSSNLINNAAEICIIASGAAKKDVVAKIIEPDPANLLPINFINSDPKAVHLCLDKDAAGGIVCY